MKKLTLLLACFFISMGFAIAQTKTIKGIVVDDTGEPIIGASVIAKGTDAGTATGLNGDFSLTLPTSVKTILVRYIGMTDKEVAVSDNMRISLSSDSKILDEVVVTAMGITREKKSLGYAHQEIKSGELTQAANSSLAGSLQGKTSGIDIKPSSGMPGSSSQVVIRGARSFTGDNTPLYVIDGMPVSSTADISTGGANFGNGGAAGTDYANRAVDIDPNDIESINILKGQAAAALYGVRASNGVIFITTKSGKGIAKGKPQITFSSNVSADEISRYPEMQTTYAQGSNGRFSTATGGYLQSFSWGPKIQDLPNDPSFGGNVPNKYNNNDPSGTKGKYYVPQRANAGLDPWVTPKVYDNIKAFFDTGITFNNSLNISQAVENTTYSISLGSTSQKGIIPTTGLDRYSGKVGAETKLHTNWKSGFNANYVNTSINKMPTANDGVVATVYPAPPSYDLAGIPSSYAGAFYKQNAYRGTAGFDYAPWSVDNNEFTEKTSRFFGNMYTEYHTKLNTQNQKLTIKYQLGADSYTTHYQNIWAYGHQNGAGQIQNFGVSNTTFNSLLTANYDWKINDSFDFNAILGNEVNHHTEKYYYQSGQSFNFPGWNHIQNAMVLSNEEEQWSDRTVGFFGNLSLVYRNMIYLGVTGRQDYVSTMPRDNRSFFYPSTSLGFILTELEPLKNLDVLNFAKLRASYAEVGAPGRYYKNYYTKPTYGGGFWGDTPITFPVAGASAYVPYTRLYDPNLKPQNTKSYELGFDVNLLKNLFSLSYTYSRQNVKDQIFPVPLAGSTGAGDIITNGGRLHTNAHEITLGIHPVRTKNVDWNLGFNWSKIENIVDELAPGVKNISLGGFVDPQIRIQKGDKYPIIYGVTYLRDKKTGKPLVDKDGLPMSGGDGVIGSVSPDFILGANTTLRLWDVTLNAVFEWKQGGQMYGGTVNLLNFYGVGKETEGREGTIIFDGVKADGTKNNIPITGPNAWQNYYNVLNTITESNIYDNSFVKMRELSLSYPVLKKSWIDLTVHVFVRNLLLWTEYPYLDPESSQGNNNMGGGFERFSLPQTTSYGGGFNVKF